MPLAADSEVLRVNARAVNIPTRQAPRALLPPCLGLAPLAVKVLVGHWSVPNAISLGSRNSAHHGQCGGALRVMAALFPSMLNHECLSQM